jgi:type IV fimbrial biogenesis protein FimT
MDREIRNPRPRLSAGLTLVELLTTLAVAIVTLTVAVPGYQSLTDNQRVRAATNGLVAHLTLARSEAVKRMARVALCPSRDAASCLDGFDWSDGFIVFVDRNRDRDRQNDEPLVRIAGPAAQLQVMTSTGRRRIVYEPDGTVLGGSNATFRVCSDRSEARNRAVIISITGRPRTSDRDAAGAPVRCS